MDRRAEEKLSDRYPRLDGRDDECNGGFLAKVREEGDEKECFTEEERVEAKRTLQALRIEDEEAEDEEQ